MSETKSMLRPCLVAALVFAVLSLVRLRFQLIYKINIPLGFIFFFALFFMGVFSLWLYRREGGGLDKSPIIVIVFGTVILYLVISLVLVTVDPLYPHIEFDMPTHPSELILYLVLAVCLLYFPNLIVGFIGARLLADSTGEGEKPTRKFYGSAVALLLLLFFISFMLWQLIPFRMDHGSGYGGFGPVKLIDHEIKGRNLSVVWVSVVGSPINITAVILNKPCGVYKSGIINEGGKVTAHWGCEENICPPIKISFLDLMIPLPYSITVDYLKYDLMVQVNYTNKLTGLKHSDTGRIWGPC